MSYEKDVLEDARDFLIDNEDMIKEAIISGSDFDRNDIDGLDEAFHETITDRAYTPKDAMVILEECNNEETDSGIWEGLAWEAMLSARAAYSYSNDVWFKLEEIYNELKERFEEEKDIKYNGLSEEEQEELDEDSINDEVWDLVWQELQEQDEVEPVEEGSEDELRLLDRWLKLASNAGMWGGYPMGRSYIDARCGSGHGMPEVKDFVDFDHAMAKKLPHMARKYKNAIQARVNELKKKFAQAPQVNDQKYNGRSNYETWAVELWMNNDDASYHYYRELAGEAQDNAAPDEAIAALADTLKEEHRHGMPEIEGVYADMLDSALSKVNWYGIAESLIKEVSNVKS